MARILAINWQDLRHPAAGGAEIHLEEILRRLARRGHEVDLLCCSFPRGKREESVDGIHIIRRGHRLTFNWVVPFVLRHLLAQKSYDIIFEDINKIPFYTPLFHRLPLLVIVPHLFSDSIFKEINPILGAYIYLAEQPFRYVYRKNEIMVISESTAEEVVSRGIPARQVHVVKCGIDDKVYWRDKTVKKFDQPTILYVGRLKKYKSIETVIDAMPLIRQRVRDARLVIIGGGDHEPHLRRHIAARRLDGAVELLGFVPQEVKVDFLRRAHLSVYPSLKEGWGLTNIEANACGTPVLAARVPGLKDSVDEGRSGLLFEHGNVREFAEKAIKILTDDDFRARLEQGALAHAAKFSWDAAALATEQLMESILSKRALV